jgi:hypothetical protein
VFFFLLNGGDKKVGVSFFESSAKTNINVTESIHQLVRLVASFRETVSPSDARTEKKGGCTLL